MAFCRARSASAKLPPRLGVGVLLLLLSEPLAPLRLMPESRGCGSAGLRPAAGRFAGGAGGAGFGLLAGGGGGARSSSTYAAGTQAWPLSLFANHHPVFHQFCCTAEFTSHRNTHHSSPFELFRPAPRQQLAVRSLAGRQNHTIPWP
jgi:hypothetical protein